MKEFGIFISAIALILSMICTYLGFSGQMSSIGGGIGWLTLSIINALTLLTRAVNKEG
jgi:hypothetical protein